MRSTFNGRNRGKSVSFRPSMEESLGGDRRELSDREDFNKIDVEEPRTVKLLPDANMTISVHNDFRDSSSNIRPYGNQSNSFREESNFNFPNNRNSQYSNRGFESYISRGRGRGSPKGYSQGQSYEYENFNYQDSNNQRYYRNESYDNHYDGRQSSNNYNQRYNTGHGYQQSDQRNNRSWPSSSKYEIDSDNQKERSDKRTFRGHSKSGNDRPRRSRGVRGYSRGRSSKDTEEGTNGSPKEIAPQPYHLYKEIEKTIIRQKKHQIIFKAQNFIPERLKANEQKRKLIIQYIEKEQLLVLKDIITEICNIDLHIASGRGNIVFENCCKTIFKSTTLLPHNSYRINMLELQNNKITIAANKSAVIVAMEIYENKERNIHKKMEVPERYIYNPTYADMKMRYSFIRKRLSLEEIRQRLLFIDAEFAKTESNKRVPLSITILNIHGEMVLNTLAYPRQMIKYYETRYHGLTEDMVIGKMDSEDMKVRVQQLIRNKILVGSDLHEDLRSLDIQPYNLCGIRDLANSINIREDMEDEKKLMKLKDMARFVLGEEIQKKFHSSEEDAVTILKIYKSVEKEWLDHKGCLVSNEIELCETCEEEHLKMNGECCKMLMMQNDFDEVTNKSEPKSKRPKLSKLDSNGKNLCDEIHNLIFRKLRRNILT